jgi:hypothetical protein
MRKMRLSLSTTTITKLLPISRCCPLIFQLYPGREFMVVTSLLIIFQLYPGREFMVVTTLLIIFQLYPDGQFMVVTPLLIMIKSGVTTIN